MHIIPLGKLRFIVSDDAGLDTLNDLRIPLPAELCGPQQVYVVNVCRPTGRSYPLHFMCRSRMIRDTVATLQRFHENYYGPGVRIENPRIEKDADWWRRTTV
jgi:hypothetical protein